MAACPIYLIQAYDERSDLPFFHEASFNGDDLWDVACLIAAGQYGENRIDAVRCFDPLTERMKDVTADVLRAVIDKCRAEDRHLPIIVEDACRIYCVRIPEGLLPDYRIDAREMHDSTLSQREAA